MFLFVVYLVVGLGVAFFCFREVADGDDWMLDTVGFTLSLILGALWPLYLILFVVVALPARALARLFRK